MKRSMSKYLLATFAIAICMAISTITAYAVTSTIDVTVSGTGTSTDPMTFKTMKDNDGDPMYYVKLTSMTGGDRMLFTAYDAYGNAVSSRYTYTSSYLNTVISRQYNMYYDSAQHAYLPVATGGNYYYLYWEAPSGVGTMKATGNYTP